MMPARIVSATVFGLLAVLLGGVCSPAAAAPAVTRAGVEADWARQAEVRRPQALPTPALDAAGGCDGVMEGKWGFHTAHEKQPWWQVDLGAETRVGRVRLHNRCDGFAGRAASFLLLASPNGVTFREVYRHGGTVFFGHSDGKPLEVDLGGVSARFLRVQLPGEDYLHLDEVEVFPAGSEGNIALGKPATQSSVSEWSSAHGAAAASLMEPAAVLARGRALAENLRALDADVATELRRFETVAARAEALPPDASPDDREEAKKKLLWAVRALTLKNPLLDFDEILFVKRAPTLLPHVSDQYY
ncbi:MAG TPA: discoidin domain-containing protein, partial [Candidatus Hydrogenedentes bacterium]|nr:discoidin domain-containing protein [Candidatus Hydrogenedentota bacterium]